MPKFAADLKEKNKGVIFYGDNFVVGIIGNNTSEETVKALEEACKATSEKVKCNMKKEVKFDFKIKGKKPVVTKEIC